MHIGIDARLTYYRVGGISTYIREMIKALEVLDTTHQYTILHSRKARENLSPRFRRFNLWTPSHNRIERLALAVELTRLRLDVLHSTDYIPPLWGAKRYVISVHDLTFLHYPQFLTRDSRRYYNDQIRAAVNQADHILTLSKASKRDIVQLLGVPADKISVQWCGVDSTFRPLPIDVVERTRCELELPPTFILFVGTFEPRKNIAGLINAYQLLRARWKDAPPLVLVGKRGWMFEETMAHIEASGLRDHILWRENVAHESLPAVYNAASVLVMPSHYEGFGLPPLEAMACGTITVVSSRSSLPEVVGDVGHTVNPDDQAAIADALHHALTDDVWRTTMRARGLERAKIFTWERTARIALDAYHTVMNTR